jgi:hypothetical protein
MKFFSSDSLWLFHIGFKQKKTKILSVQKKKSVYKMNFIVEMYDKMKWQFQLIS